MSADQYDVEQAGGALAQPAVDILPVTGGKRAKQPEAQPDAAAWSAPVPAPVDAVNPWTGQPEQPAQPVVAEPVPAASVAETAADGSPAKKFLGMQLRRSKKDEAPVADQAVVDASVPAWGPPAPADGSGSPVAAWPTDVGVPVVAGAEPSVPSWGPPAPSFGTPVEAPVSDAYADTHPSELADAVPAEAPAEPVEVAVEPVAVTPAVVPVQDDELRALRAQLEASEAARLAAERRADQAVAYAQQTQAELAAAREETQSKVAAVETRARAAANDAQDWQIRHREAETQIAELVASVSGAEQRLAEMRSERDELMSALEEATKPEHVTQA